MPDVPPTNNATGLYESLVAAFDALADARDGILSAGAVAYALTTLISTLRRPL